MKKIQNNLHYFNISKEHPEKLLDEFYIFDDEHPELYKYIDNIKKIKDLLITINTLHHGNERKAVVDKYYVELSKTICEYSNCSEFVCFINACDNIMNEVKKEPTLLKEITKRYLLKRKFNETVPCEWVQAILDKNSSSKKGKCGENKLVDILQKASYREVFDWSDFLDTDYCVIKFSSKFSLRDVRQRLGIKIKTKKQNKILDLIIKAKDRILLCEAKHLNTSGGEQDKQISELIEILNLVEKNGISYISFLDGKYSNALLSNTLNGAKINTQRQEIEKYLVNNPLNYWVNTAGFEMLIHDLKKR